MPPKFNPPAAIERELKLSYTLDSISGEFVPHPIQRPRLLLWFDKVAITLFLLFGACCLLGSLIVYFTLSDYLTIELAFGFIGLLSANIGGLWVFKKELKARKGQLWKWVDSPPVPFTLNSKQISSNGKYWSWDTLARVSTGLTQNDFTSVTLTFDDGDTITHVGPKKTTHWLAKKFKDYQTRYDGTKAPPNELDRLLEHASNPTEIR